MMFRYYEERLLVNYFWLTTFDSMLNGQAMEKVKQRGGSRLSNRGVDYQIGDAAFTRDQLEG